MALERGGDREPGSSAATTSFDLDARRRSCSSWTARWWPTPRSTGSRTTTDGRDEFRLGRRSIPTGAGAASGAGCCAGWRSGSGGRPAEHPTEQRIGAGLVEADARVGKRPCSSRRATRSPATSSRWCARPGRRSSCSPLPDGHRAATGARGAPRAICGDADVEVFRDHWGGFDGSEASFQSVERSRSAARPEPVGGRLGGRRDRRPGRSTGSTRGERRARRQARLGAARSACAAPWRRRGLARALVAREPARPARRGDDERRAGRRRREPDRRAGRSTRRPASASTPHRPGLPQADLAAVARR